MNAATLTGPPALKQSTPEAGNLPGRVKGNAVLSVDSADEVVNLPKTMPLFLVRQVKGNPLVWSFWCPVCEAYHAHGEPEGDDHREAHCRKGPLKRTGYLIRKASGDGRWPYGKNLAGILTLAMEASHD
jgi:hypothetical protein